MATNKSADNVLNQIEDTLELYLVKKAPSLPENIKDLLVKVTPWVNILGIVLGVLAIPVLLTVLGLGAVLSPFMAMGGVNAVQAGVAGLAWAIVALIALVFQILAAKGLFDHKAKAWRYLYWAEGISIAGNILSFSITGIIVTGIILYLLFQIKSYYK